MLWWDKVTQEEEEAARLTEVQSVSNKIVRTECKAKHQEIIEFMASKTISNTHPDLPFTKDAQVCAAQTTTNSISKDFTIITPSMSKFASSVSYGYAAGHSPSFASSTEEAEDGEDSVDIRVEIPPLTVQSDIASALA